jgi:hypothetical protein
MGQPNHKLIPKDQKEHLRFLWTAFRREMRMKPSGIVDLDRALPI